MNLKSCLRNWACFSALSLAVMGLLHSAIYADQANPRTFTFRVQDEPETLDWNRAHTLVEANILMNLMEGLVTFDGQSKVQPALAQSWTVSPDSKTYTFHLRSGVKWSDGVPLKAQDFVDSWKRLLSPLTAAPYAYLLFDVVGAEGFNKGSVADFDDVGIKALDDSTFQVQLVHPVAHWIYIPAFWVTFPIRKDIVKTYGEGWETPGRIVTLGPYLLSTHDINSKIVMKANPLYYGQHGNVEQVVALIVKDTTTAVTLYQAGKIDFLADLPLSSVRAFNGKPDYRTFPLFKTVFLGFVVDKYPVSNLRFRKAIAMALDKNKLVQILGGGEAPAQSFVPPGLLGHSKSAGIAFDPLGARTELRLSGVEIGDMKVSYVLPNWEKSQKVGKFIQDQLKNNLGVIVNLQSLDNQTYRTQLDLLTFPLFDYSWTSDYPDPDTFLSVFLSTSGNSRTNWKNARFDEQVIQARKARTSAEREKLYANLQKILLQDDIVIVPLYYEPTLALVRTRAKNFELNSLGYLYLRKVNVIP